MSIDLYLLRSGYDSHLNTFIRNSSKNHERKRKALKIKTSNNENIYSYIKHNQPHSNVYY